MDLLDRQHWVYFRFHNAFEQRIAACQALAILGPDAKAAIPDLTNELNEFVFGWSAAYALSQIGPPAAPVLMNALTNSVPWVRADAAFGLGALGEPSSASNLLAVLKDSEWTTRSSAVDALQAFPDQASLIVPALVNSLDDPNYVVQVHVERALGSFGPTARPAFPKLLHMIASTNDIASRDAAIALVKIDFDGAFIAFTNNLNSSDIQVRRTTVLALMYFKSTGEPAVPRLIKCLNDPDVTVRAHAAIALGAIGKDPDLAVPALMANLNDPDPAVQVGAAMALRSFGARAKPAVPQILRIINENKRNHYTVRSLYKALADIDPETAAKYPHRNP
jgi:HEAT repeat protein